MYRKIIKQTKYSEFKRKYPKLTLGTIVIMLLCSFLLVVATFSQLSFLQVVIPEQVFLSPFKFFSKHHTPEEFIINFNYIPQIPAVIFIGALLGPRIGFFAIAFYIIAGLIGFPVFALGGGIPYFTQLGFGYILAYFAGVYITGRLFKGNVTNFTLIKSSILGVLSIHLIGILYLSVLMLFQREQFFLLLNWVWLLSGMQLFYDLLFSFIAISLVRPVKSVLWLVMH